MGKLFKKDKLESENKNISKSLMIIKKEKNKIKEEKKKIKLEKEKKFYNTKFGIFLKDFFDVNENEEFVSKIIRRRVWNNFINIIFGMVLCLIILFILSGGKNYLKLYSELNELIEVYDTISNEYYGEFDNKNVISSAIDSMVNSVGDIYTTYSNSLDNNSFMENLNGTYEGIGCKVTMDKDSNIYVLDIFDGSPADKAGLIKNDIILEVDGVDYSNKTSEDMSNYVKEEAKDKILVKIKREEKELTLNIVRSKVEIPSVVGEVIENEDLKLGYMKIDIFSSVTDKQFEKILKKLEKKNIKGLIIDVRGNNGGYLDVVTDISSLFLKKGKVIYQLEEDLKKEKVKDKTDDYRKYPVVVLVNGNSASASEILAASIKDSYSNGYVVGVNTYGKGTVQKTKKLKNGSMIKYTVQKWLTPKGTYIDKNGIIPTDIVEFESNGFREDSQLDYSINLLNRVIKEK